MLNIHYNDIVQLTDMKLVKTEIQTFKKGEVYNLADGTLNLPKIDYPDYFENDDQIDGEWMAMDKCKKTFKIVTKIYSNE